MLRRLLRTLTACPSFQLKVCELFPVGFPCHRPRQPRIPAVECPPGEVVGVAGLVIVVAAVYWQAAFPLVCLKCFALGDDVHFLRVGLDAVVGLFPFGLLCHFLCGGLPRRAPLFAVVLAVIDGHLQRFFCHFAHFLRFRPVVLFFADEAQFQEEFVVGDCQ